MADESKPTGTYKCLGCNQIWDGKELYHNPQIRGSRFICGDLCCGASVIRISDLPKKDMIDLEGKLKINIPDAEK